MVDTMNVPGIGNVKKGYVYAGGALTIGIVGYAYYKHKASSSSAASTASTASTATTTPSATDPNAIDPATGIPYSQESSYGMYGSGYGSPVSSYGGSYYGTGTITGYDQYGNPIYSTGITGNEQYTTNSGWATQAENDLQGAGVDYQTAATAISKVLAGLSVTSAQQQLFMQAVGLDGQPPQGYPTPIKIVDTPAQPGNSGGSTSAGMVTIPNLAGQSAGAAHNALVSLGLVPVAPPSQKANMKVWYTNPRAGSTVSKGTHVTIDTQGYV